MVTIRVFYEAPVQNLQSFLATQKTRHQSKNLSMEVLTHLMYQMIDVNSWLQERGIYHGNICPSTVMLDSNGGFRLLYKGGQTPERLQLEKLLKNELIYMSPKLYQSFKNRNFDRVSHVPCKSDVFSLGLVILEAGLLQNVQVIYQPDGSVDRQVLTVCLNQFSELYKDNPLLLSSVRKMVEVDEMLRPDFGSLKAVMPGYEKIKAYFSTLNCKQVFSDNFKSNSKGDQPSLTNDQLSVENRNKTKFDGNPNVQIRVYDQPNPHSSSQQRTTHPYSHSQPSQSRFLPSDSNSTVQWTNLAPKPQISIYERPTIKPYQQTPNPMPVDTPANDTKIINGKTYRPRCEERIERLESGEIVKRVVYVLREVDGDMEFKDGLSRPVSSNISTVHKRLHLGNKGDNEQRRPTSQQVIITKRYQI